MNAFRKVSLYCIFSASVSTLWAQGLIRTHEVQSGETLFSIGKKYGVSVEQIKQSNPQLGSNLMAGMTLKIPATTATIASSSLTGSSNKNQTKQTDCKQMYLVEKKETVYAIAHKFGVSEEALRKANPQIDEKNKIKKGEYLCIPYSDDEWKIVQQQRQEEQEAKARAEQEQRERERQEARQLNQLNVAVILPFALDKGGKTKEGQKMVDFYEGFLMAVEDIKKRGISVNIYAYEEKYGQSTSIDSILRQPMMTHMNLIVGPMRAEHIPAVGRFAKQHNIPVAVPFSTKAGITTNAPTLFQINTLTSSLYQKVYKEFIAQHTKDNIIFLYCADKQDRPDYIIGFKNALKDHDITYRTADNSDLATIENMMDEERTNIIIPSSPSQQAFEHLTTKLQANEAIKTKKISLFGFPEWQTFTEHNKSTIRAYQGSFFTTFYTNPGDMDIKRFKQRFQENFKHEQYASVPLFGVLGYDVGNYFLEGVHHFGADFIKTQYGLNVKFLQNPMSFERGNANNGFINTSIRIVKH